MKAASLRAPKAADSLSKQQAEEVLRILEEYLASLEGGVPPHPGELVARHPRHAEVLRAYLAQLDQLHEVAIELQEPAPAARRDAVEQECLGDYRLVREVGRGGMGIVYEAEQISLARRVALKVLPFAAMLDDRALQRFKNEARAAALIDHPHIVDIYGVGCDRGIHYYAMRLIDGQTVAELIAQMRTGHARTADDSRPTVSALASRHESRPPEAASHRAGIDEPSMPPAAWTAAAAESPRQMADSVIPRSTGGTKGSLPSGKGFYQAVAEIGMHVAEALETAHALGVIHRDIKPSNLLLDASGKAWITDFGLAHLEASGSMTMTGDLLGTLRYMSPEAASGGARRAGVDHRTDIYSLGVTLYELLALRPAFGDDEKEALLRRIIHEEPRRLSLIDPRVPPALETIILKCIEKKIEHRYLSAAELSNDLRRFLSDEPIHARRPTARERLARWARRHAVVVRTAVLTTVVAACLGGALVWHQRSVAIRERDLAFSHRLRSEENLRATTGALMDVHYTLTSPKYHDSREVAEAREIVAAKILEAYQSLIQEGSSDPLVLRDSAAMHLCIACFNVRFGKMTEAAESFSRSADVWAALADESPADWIYRQELAMACDQLGQVRHAMGDLSGADEAFLRAKEHYLRAVQIEPDQHGSQLNLAFLFAGRRDSRLFDAAKAIHWAEAGLRTAKAHATDPVEITNAQAMLAVAWLRSGRPRDAAGLFETALRGGTRARATSHLFLSIARHELGDAETARRLLAEADRFMEEHPESQLRLLPVRAEAARRLGVSLDQTFSAGEKRVGYHPTDESDKAQPLSGSMHKQKDGR